MPTLQEQLAALNEALAGAERQVALGAQQVTYRSINELIAARNELLRQAQERSADPRPTAKRTFMYQAGRGYC